MDTLYRCCAGLDVHKKTVVACVRKLAPSGEVDQQVLTFGTMTDELLALSDWLQERGDPFGEAEVLARREVGGARRRLVHCQRAHPPQMEGTQVVAQVAPAHQEPGAPALEQAVGIDVALGALAQLHVAGGHRDLE